MPSPPKLTKAPSPPSIDTPTMEARIAQLETYVDELLADVRALKNQLQRLPKAPLRPRNCRKCGRQLNVPKGAPCPLCSELS